MKKTTSKKYTFKHFIEQNRIQRKPSTDVPIFSLKSALLIMFFGLIGSIVFPLIFQLFGINHLLLIVIGNFIFTGFGTAYVRQFIESKNGFSKTFWIQGVVFGTIFAIISYFWMYKALYI